MMVPKDGCMMFDCEVRLIRQNSPYFQEPFNSAEADQAEAAWLRMQKAKAEAAEA